MDSALLDIEPQESRRMHSLVVPASRRARPTIQGKFLFVDGEKFYVCGVTYGAFRPDEDKNEYFDLITVS